MKNLYDYSYEKLQFHLVNAGFKLYNATQVFQWLYKKRITDFDQMSNISKHLRTYLKNHFTTSQIGCFTQQEAEDETVKFLFSLDDKHLIETVWMHHYYGDSLCVTSQVGCNIGCSFCASGLKKKTRNLRVSEMVLQVLKAEALQNQRVSHVVLMGTGEPFDNFENVMDFIDIINHPHAFEIGKRHITVSTAGIVPKIDAFAKRQSQVNLAISLHATNDALRSKLMPINKVYPIKKLLDSAKRYTETTHRRVTFEYLLLKGVNDSMKDADDLSDLLRGLNCYVNLIPYNSVAEFNYQGSDLATQERFYKRLLKRGITATLRQEKGADIDAACGQLRIKEDE